MNAIIPAGKRRVELSLGSGDYASVAAAGVFGAIPVTAWVATLLVPFDGGVGARPNVYLAGVVAAVGLASILVAPWLVPVLVLRARQPRGARIEWDDDGVTEWDGPWKKESFAWSEARAAHVTWTTTTRSGSHTDEALQIVGAMTGRAITAWTSPPDGAPALRRRLRSKDVARLREALVERGIELSLAPDWGLAADPDRPPHRALSIVGRLGYPLAVLAPLVTPVSHVAGAILGVFAAGLLAARATPAFREVRAIVARLTPSSPPPAPDDETGPYRAAPTPPTEPPADDGRVEADRLKLRAAAVEAAVRAGCVLLVALSTGTAFVALR